MSSGGGHNGGVLQVFHDQPAGFKPAWMPIQAYRYTQDCLRRQGQRKPCSTLKVA